MFAGHPVSIKAPLSLFCSNHCYIIQQSTKKVSALAASGILQLDSFLLPCPVLSFLFPKSHLMCLVAALRHTLLTIPLLFDFCSVFLFCPLLFLLFTLSDITASLCTPAIHPYSVFLSSELCQCHICGPTQPMLAPCGPSTHYPRDRSLLHR